MKSRVKSIAVELLQAQVETGVASAGLNEMRENAEKLGDGFQKIADLCDQFKLT